MKITIKQFSCGLGALVLVVVVTLYLQQQDKQPTLASLTEYIENDLPGPDTRPSDWAWERRTFPHYVYDAEALQAELVQARDMRLRASQRPIESAEFAGPTNVGGRIVDIEFHQQDPNIVYAGAAAGGIFKSTDLGETWVPIFDDNAILTIGDIGVDPVNSDILYVGTGEANGGHNNFFGGGVYKSTDGGASWSFQGLESTVSIGRVLVDPNDTDRVFVAAVGSYFAPNEDRGLFRSTDGGASWELSHFVTDSTGAIDVVMQPDNSNNMMVAFWERVRRPNSSHLYGETSDIYRSTDGGDSWEVLGPATGLPNPEQTNVGRIGLAISMSEPNTVYALYNNGSSYLGFFKTTDFGNSWTDVDPDNEISEGMAGFSWYFGQVRVHPQDPNTVFVLDVAYMRSTNGGASWPIMYGYEGNMPSMHVDHHALAFHPTNPDIIFDGNDGGINISTDGGVNFTDVEDLPITQFYEIGLDATNPERLYGGTQDNGTVRTTTGAHDDWDLIYGGDGFYVIVDPTNPNIIYAESQFGWLGKSTNGGQTFSTILDGISDSEPTNWSTPVSMDPHNPAVLYYGTDRVYRTTNAGGVWNDISDDLSDGIPGTRLGTVTTINASPANTDIIWAGTDDSHVWVTDDYGTSWTDVSASLPYRWVTRVIPDPHDENTCYVTFNGLKWVDHEPHVFRTTDLGQTWEDLSAGLPNMPVNAFVVDPENTSHLFVGGDLGAYFSQDLGASWEYISSDFPLVSVYDMKIHPTENFLVLGTHARSMYKIDIATITSVDPVDEAPIADFKLAQNFPNPFNPSTAISLQLPVASQIQLTVYDVRGSVVRELANGPVAAGGHEFSWDGNNNAGQAVASGQYFYTLTATSLFNDGNNFTQTRKMTLIR